MSSVESNVRYIVFIFTPKKTRIIFLNDAQNRQSNLLSFLVHFSKTASCKAVLLLLLINLTPYTLCVRGVLSFNLAYRCEGEEAIFKVLI